MMQLDHVNLYVADLARSRTFYEGLMPTFGQPLVRDHSPIAVGFGDRNYAVLALVGQTEKIQPVHLAFRCDSRGEVDDAYALALRLGAASNGEPGLRPHYHETYYAAFVLDPDGHNLEFVCHE